MSNLLGQAPHGPLRYRIMHERSRRFIHGMLQQIRPILRQIGRQGGDIPQHVMILPRETDIRQSVEHSQEGGAAGAGGGYDEEVAAVTGEAEGGVEAFGIGTPGAFVGVSFVEWFPVGCCGIGIGIVIGIGIGIVIVVAVGIITVATATVTDTAAAPSIDSVCVCVWIVYKGRRQKDLFHILHRIE